MSKTTEVCEIIRDEGEFLRFVEWLPELQEGECYYVALFARKKYHPSAQNDKTSLKRFTALSKESLVSKVRQLEIPVDSYLNKDGSSTHEDSLALYITPNPRSLQKASKSVLKNLLDKVLTGANVNPAVLSMSEVQKSKSRACYVDFDFDLKGSTEFMLTMGKIFEILPIECFCIVHTRGGFHCLVDPKKAGELAHVKNWHKAISAIEGADVSGDNMTPVPGCTQGGFTPILDYT